MTFETSATRQDGMYGTLEVNYKNNTTTFHPRGREILISDITESIENGHVEIGLSFQFDGRWKTVRVPRENLFDPKMFSELAASGADIPSTNTWVLIDTLRQQQEILEREKRVWQVYEKLGWFHSPVYDEKGRPTSQCLCFRHSALLGSTKEARYSGSYAVTAKGTKEAYFRAVKKYVIGYTPLAVVFLEALSSVVNGIVAPNRTGENPILHLNGESGTGKSTAAILAASTVGAPLAGENPSMTLTGRFIKRLGFHQSWGATPNATIARCEGNRGAVIIFDELGKFSGSDLTPVIYNLSEGTDKERLTADLKARRSATYFTTFLSVGESSLLDRCKSKLEGLRVRVMEISDKMTADAAHAERLKRVCFANYGFAVPMMAEYIIRHGGERFVLDIYDRYCASLRGRFPDTPLRDRFISKFPALIMTTAEIAREALNLPIDLEKIATYYIEYEKQHGRERSTGLDSYETVINECRVNAHTFITRDAYPKGEVNGKISYPNKKAENGKVIVEEYSIRRPFLAKVLERNGFQNAATCAKQWKNAGVLDYEKGRLTRSRKILDVGKAEDVFVLRVYASAEESPQLQKEKKERRRLLKSEEKPKSPTLRELLRGDDEDGDCA